MLVFYSPLQGKAHTVGCLPIARILRRRLLPRLESWVTPQSFGTGFKVAELHHQSTGHCFAAFLFFIL